MKNSLGKTITLLIGAIAFLFVTLGTESSMRNANHGVYIVMFEYIGVLLGTAAAFFAMHCAGFDKPSPEEKD